MRFTKDHEWVRAEGDTATVGITKYAADALGDVVFVDQSPIGKTARSNPASYVGAWDCVREIFATAPLSRQRGYTGSKFSFNSGDGRCPTCGGSGYEHVEMQFLSDVYLRCPDCDGRRFRGEILEVTLDLFNRFGEPNVSTTLISAELSISPGNLYYHYPAKDELINSLFDRYERSLSRKGVIWSDLE